ncbi:MAG TPA: ROK family protein [Ferrovibrio sp.]|uniref:ROK family protein n=1 Tax=Ferrovibrio sp. TaxID=1917215 RepID=UPI002B4B3D37|nr:ROK family protein [Ferrovibrio sp.]HLT78922.1 ROK family protein [Ferrovibrio sp.]
MRIGVDLGGTKIEAIALADDGTIRARRRIPAPRGDYRATVTAIRDLVQATEAEAGEAGPVGVGIPGTISPATGLIKNANSVWLIGHAMDRDLTAATGRRVRLANDANCFALSEASDGAGRGYPVVFGAILGTGCGSGIVVDGRVLVGPNAIAGEWGHIPLPWREPSELPGPLCYCGKYGCQETFLSGTGLELDFRQATGRELDGSAIVAAAGAGDQAAELALQRYEHRLARGLAAILNVLDPDVVVLGGGLSNLDRLYANVPRLWAAFAFSDTVTTPLVKNQHGDSSGVRGAAWLWPPGTPPAPI